MAHLRRETESDIRPYGTQLAQRQPLLLVVEDGDAIADALQPICDFLDIGIERFPSEYDLAGALNDFCPMGVVAHLDCKGQDGCHIMKIVSIYDRSLPILLLTGEDPALTGAVDAVEELWQLEAVAKCPYLPTVGSIVDFIFRAGRKGRCTRLVSV